MNPTKNLWGELPSGESLAVPSAILREQAEILTDHTKGLLVGKVVPGGQAKDDSMLFHFDIVAPFLSDYRYRLISVHHPVTLYPVKMMDRLRSIETTSNSEEEFVDNLADTLASDETRHMIAVLLAQIRAETQ